MIRSAGYGVRPVVVAAAMLVFLGGCSDTGVDGHGRDAEYPADARGSDASGEDVNAPDGSTADVLGSERDASGDVGGGDASDQEDAPGGEDGEDGEGPSPRDPVALKVIAFNDLHGHLAAPAGKVRDGSVEVDAGGVAYLKAWADELRRDAQHTVLVSAGDLVGASPLMSAMFHDEPTIDALNVLGLEVSAVGNHEFDAGWQELLRLQHGGCHASGCLWREPFGGAAFSILAANVETASGDTLLAATTVKEYDGVRVGFIGLTLKETGEITRPSATDGLRFQNEVTAIDREVDQLRAQGIEAIVVLIHEGGVPQGARAGINDCGNLQGPIVDIVRGASPAVDVFVSGHTHQTYICDIDGRLVTSAFSYGRILTEIDLTLDPVSGDVLQKSAINHVVRNQGMAPDEELAEFVADLTARAAAADPVVGQITKTINRTLNAAGESPLGELVADSHLWATQASGDGGAQIAFANSGGVRANLSSSGATPQNPGDIKYSQVHAVLPFGNTLVTMTLTGAQIHQLLEQQFGDTEYAIMQVSRGFQYTWRQNAARGSHVDPQSIRLNGAPLDPAGSYRVTVNSYMAEGGDALQVLTQGTQRVQGLAEVDTFAQYLRAHSPVAPPTPARITRVER